MSAILSDLPSTSSATMYYLQLFRALLAELLCHFILFRNNYYSDISYFGVVEANADRDDCLHMRVQKRVLTRIVLIRQRSFYSNYIGYHDSYPICSKAYVILENEVEVPEVLYFLRPTTC